MVAWPERNPPLAAPAQKRVLVIDESPANAAALAEVFRAGGCAVEIAPDVEAPPPSSRDTLDLVVLGLGRGLGARGLDVLRTLRAADAPRFLPVMVVSAGDDRAQRLEALELGADDALATPWDGAELAARARRHFEVARRLNASAGELDGPVALGLTDPLTQLPNLRHFRQRLRQEFRRAQRFDDALALVLVDLDDFRAVNSRLGRSGADEALKKVATSLLRSVRDTDFVARYGGEEFGLLFPKTHVAGAITSAERVLRDLGALDLGSNPTVRLTASLGVSVFPNRSVVSADHLFRTADEALYRAKRDGRNRIGLHHAHLLATESR